jgi:hypothetical protein
MKPTEKLSIRDVAEKDGEFVGGLPGQTSAMARARNSGG